MKSGILIDDQTTRRQEVVKDFPAAVDPGGVVGGIYLASPIQTYETSRYDRLLAAATLLFPNGTLMPARDLFASSHHWRREWPFIAQSAAALVAFADETGWIGWGTYQEVGALLARGAPVWFLDDAGTLFPWASIQILEIQPSRWSHYVRLKAAGSLCTPSDG